MKTHLFLFLYTEPYIQIQPPHAASLPSLPTHLSTQPTLRYNNSITTHAHYFISLYLPYLLSFSTIHSSSPSTKPAIQYDTQIMPLQHSSINYLQLSSLFKRKSKFSLFFSFFYKTRYRNSTSSFLLFLHGATTVPFRWNSFTLKIIFIVSFLYYNF